VAGVSGYERKSNLEVGGRGIHSGGIGT
jgi:hypothetical protein